MSDAKKALSSLAIEVLEIQKQIIENDGVLPAELEAKLDLNGELMADKVDSYKYVLDACEWGAAWMKSMADQATARRKSFEGIRERLKANVKFSMLRMDTTDLKGHEHRFKLSQLKSKLVIDETRLPQTWWKEVTTTTLVPDKESIEAQLLLGIPIEGASFEPVHQIRVYPNNEPKQVKGTKDAEV